MTISSTVRSAGPYVGNGVTTSYPFAFKVFSAEDVVVVRTDASDATAALAYGLDFTVNLNADQDANPGGTVVLASPLANGYTLDITSGIANLQPVDFTNQGGFYPKVLNAALDRMTILIQQIAEQNGGTPGAGQVPPSAATFTQSGASAIARLMLDKLREIAVSVKDFGAVCDGANNDSAAITAANTEAQVRGVPLIFPAGTYFVGNTSFSFDPQKTRWVAEGVVALQWASAPASGYGVRVVAGETNAYTNVRKMVAHALDGIALLGGSSASALITGDGLRIGNGANATCNISFNNLSVQGWTNTVAFTDHVWSIRFHNPRLLWGNVTMPAAPINFGENMHINAPFFADGCNIQLSGGEWTINGGSLDNGQLYIYGDATVKWYGPHFENPGTTTIAVPYVALNHINATCYLHDVFLVTNTSGVAGSITGTPFYSADVVTVGGLFIDGLKFTQQPAYGFEHLVSGKGRCVVRGVVPQSLANAWYKTIASNHPGALRNAGFEEGTTAGWATTVTGTGGIWAGNNRVRTGSYSMHLQCQGGAGFVWGYATQNQNCSAGNYVAVTAYISRDLTGLNVGETGVINCSLKFLDSTGAVISTNQIGTYSSAAAGTNDGTTFTPYRWAGFAPAGAVQAQVRIECQRPSGTGTAMFYIDDVTLNVAA